MRDGFDFLVLVLVILAIIALIILIVRRGRL